MRLTTVLRPIVLKELRETVGIAALGALFALYVVSIEMVGVFPWSDRQDHAIPFLSNMGSWPDNSTFTSLIWVAVPMALALGIKQTAWETHNGTFLFLLHRPVSWRWMMATKVAVGILLYATAMSVAVLVYALWAATPGTHASPYFWSVTISSWQGILTGVLVYLGSFVSGLVPGRWYGSKLLPLVAVTAIAFALILFDGAWPLISLVAVLLTMILLWHVILLVCNTREYA